MKSESESDSGGERDRENNEKDEEMTISMGVFSWEDRSRPCPFCVRAVEW